MLDRLVSFRFWKIANGLSLPTSRIYSARFGLSLLDWRVLSTLEHHAPISVNEIAAKIDADKGNVSRSIAALTKKRLVHRKPSESDGRKVNLLISTKGSELFGQINPLARGRESQLLSALTALEREQLETIMQKLLDQLERMNADSAA